MILKTFTLEAWDVQHLFFVSRVYFFVKLPFWEKAFGMKKSRYDLIHSKHLGDLSLVIFINASLIKKVFVNLEFPSFPSFQFWPLYKNRKLGKLGNFFKTCRCFAGGSWKFPRFPSFRFWPLCWNRKFGKIGNFFKACKVKWICSV